MPIVIGGGVAIVFVAVALLLYVYAIEQVFRRPINIALPSLPVIGDAIARAVNLAIGGIVAWATAWAKGSVYPLVELIWVPAQAVYQAVTGIVGGIEAAASALALVPGRIAVAAANAAAAISVVASNLATVGARLGAVAASIPTIAHQVATDLVAAAVALLRGDLATAEADLRAAIGAAAAGAASDLAILRGTLESELAAASVAAAAATAALRGQLGTDVGQLQGQLAQLGLAVGPLVAAGLIARTLTLETELDTMRRECVDPVCSVLGPTLGTLQAFGTLATMGLVGAFVAEAIHDPEGTARATMGLVAGVEGTVTGLAEAFLGVPI